MVDRQRGFAGSAAGFFLLTGATALLLTMAMPAMELWPLLFVALVPLFVIIARCRPGRALAAGFAAGILYHTALLYWIIIVLGRYGALPLWLSIPALMLLSMYMAMYMAVFAGLLSLVIKRTSSPAASLIILAPLLWVGLEWLRARLFTGFPWMDLGYGLYGRPLLIQMADLGGHYLITFCIVLVNALLYFLLTGLGQGKGRFAARGGMPAAAGAAVLLVVLYGYSMARYFLLQDRLASASGIEVGVVQGNIPQDEKWTPDSKRLTLEIYRGLSEGMLEAGDPALLVWPETALPFYPVNDPLFEEVTGLAGKHHIWLLSGAPYFTLSRPGDLLPPAVEYFNSALLLSPEGNVMGRYDKQHLVPFGEYVPLRRFLPFLEPLVETVGTFSTGISAAPLKAGSMQLGVLICYESIFPDLARRTAAAGANLLVNITNDAWYGNSSAPYQSFAMAVLRSVETRRSLVRAANTGISGFVDPLGRVIYQTQLFEPAAISAKLVLLDEQSVFSRFGYLFAPGCLLLFILLIPLLRKKE